MKTENITSKEQEEIKQKIKDTQPYYRFSASNLSQERYNVGEEKYIVYFAFSDVGGHSWIEKIIEE